MANKVQEVEAEAKSIFAKAEALIAAHPLATAVVVSFVLGLAVSHVL